MTADPFTALGLPARPGLTDDDVRAAWRRVAAATHPDRADGGDPARFAAAAAAYTELRTRSGRGEAYADLISGDRRRPGPAARVPPGTIVTPAPDATAASGAPPDPDTMSVPGASPGPRPAPDPDAAPPRDTAAAARPGGLRARGRPAAGLATRIRRGRPALLALRVAIAAGLSAAALAVVGAQPAAAGLTVGALTWLLLTARHDIAPPG